MVVWGGLTNSWEKKSSKRQSRKGKMLLLLSRISRVWLCDTPWMEKLDRLQFMESQRVGYDWATSLSVYSVYLLLISSPSVRSIPFLSFFVPIFAWNVPLVSLIFLRRSLVFPILLFSSISLHWSLRKAFLSFLAIFWNSVFKWVYLSFSLLPLASLLYSAICKASSDKHFAFCISFSWGWSWSLPPVQCHKSLSIVFQTFYQI